MAELYPGQSSVVASKLREAELLQQADEEQLKAETDPMKRSNLLRRLAARVGHMDSYRRQLAKCQDDGGDSDQSEQTRSEVVRMRLTPEQAGNLRVKASEQGMTLSDYIRLMCGI